jgi:hypothetical protein
MTLSELRKSVKLKKPKKISPIKTTPRTPTSIKIAVHAGKTILDALKGRE